MCLRVDCLLIGYTSAAQSIWGGQADQPSTQNVTYKQRARPGASVTILDMYMYVALALKKMPVMMNAKCEVHVYVHMVNQSKTLQQGAHACLAAA